MSKKKADGLTQCEVAAMWFFNETYSAQALGAREFWQCLSIANKDLIQRMVTEICKATRFTR